MQRYDSMYNDEEVLTFPTDNVLILAVSVLLVFNGVIGIGVLAIFGFNVVFWLIYSGFIILGVLMHSYHSDAQKGIIGLVGMVASFYAGIFWSQSGYIPYPFSTIMTAISMLVLILSFATVCFATCTWPNYDYD